MEMLTITEELDQLVAELNLEEQCVVVELLRLLIDNRVGKKRSIMELAGLGKEIWEGIDAQEYVDELRGKREPDDTPGEAACAAQEYADKRRGQG